MTRLVATRTLDWSAPGGVLVFLAGLIAGLAVILTATSTSASAAGVAGTRVGASAVVVEPLVGPPEHITAVQRLGNDPTRVVTTVATGVAANAAARAPSVIRVGELKLPGMPKGVTGTPTRSGKRLEYQIPRGTPEIDPRVASIRVMDPVTTGKYQYPNG